MPPPGGVMGTVGPDCGAPAGAVEPLGMPRGNPGGVGLPGVVVWVVGEAAGGGVAGWRRVGWSGSVRGTGLGCGAAEGVGPLTAG